MENKKNKNFEPYLYEHEKLVNIFFVSKVLSFKEQLYTSGLYMILPGILYIVCQAHYGSSSHAFIALCTAALGMGIMRAFGYFGNDHQYMNMAVTNQRVQLYRRTIYRHVYLEEAFDYDDILSVTINEGYINYTITLELQDGQIVSYICFKGSLGNAKEYLLSKYK